jgi:uncharacterized protein (TIGR00369 family)
LSGRRPLRDGIEVSYRIPTPHATTQHLKDFRMSKQNRYKSFGLVSPEVAAGLPGLDLLQGMIAGKYPAPPFSETTDIWLAAAEAGRIVFEGEPSQRFYNPMGVVHGGWLSALLDSAMGCAVQSSLEAGKAYTTIELKTVFVKPVIERTGRLRCEASLLSSGRRVASAEGKVFDGNGTLLAYGSETCLIMDARAGTTRSTTTGDAK